LLFLFFFFFFFFFGANDKLYTLSHREQMNAHDGRTEKKIKNVEDGNGAMEREGFFKM